jgi:hypothetical protein
LKVGEVFCEFVVLVFVCFGVGRSWVYVDSFSNVIGVSRMFAVSQCVPPVVPPHYWGSGVRYFPPKVGVASLVRRIVCCYEPDLWVVLMGWWYVGEFFDGEPLPVAPS